MALLRTLVRPRLLLVLTALACWASVGLALLSQYRFDMPPCPWCSLQRLIFLLLGAVALLGAVVAPLRKPLAALGVLLAASGAAAALWQHFVAAASASCNMTLADRILESLGLLDWAPEVFMPMASCADAAVNLLGVPYAFWSLALFALAGLACLAALRR
ncbi:MAG: disulfide bond formation protein B [Burkholderiales bacterium]|nr:disulfide bond formation protein B [Burkholderiales bacterium]